MGCAQDQGELSHDVHVMIFHPNANLSKVTHVKWQRGIFLFFFLRNRQTQLEISMRTLKPERKEQTVFIFIYFSSTYFYSDMYRNYFTDSSRKMTKKQNTQILNGSKYCIV
mgnify:CR=1 FL=1